MERDMTNEQREGLLSYISDAYKDAHGFRPRGAAWDAYVSMTDEQLVREADELSDAVGRAIDEERHMQAQAAINFEARIRDVIEAGAGDRQTAVRWLHDAHDTDGDHGFLEYKFGLRYGYIEEMMSHGR